MDPYTLLGLTPGADLKSVKHAFRRLAMQWHPDRNPAPDAIERFKDIRAAYEVLLAELALAPQASQPRPRPARPRKPEPRRGDDRQLDLEISIETACLGGEQAIEVEDRIPCHHCGGSGEEALSHSRLCSDCYGSGKVRRDGGLVNCPSCGGRGYISRQTCSACHGSGLEQGLNTLQVRIPPGMAPGETLRLAGKGHPSPEDGGAPGDLLLRLTIAPHPLYRLVGRDLHLGRPVSALRMLLGGSLEIPHPGGTRTIELSPGAPSTREVRVEGAGLPARDAFPAGALVVTLRPLLPDAAADLHAQFEALQQHLEREPARYLPELASWEALWLSRH